MEHAKRYVVSPSDLERVGDSSKLSPSEREVVRVVVDKLGGLSGEDLRKPSHSEAPWRDAHVSVHARGGNVISIAAMAAYYQAERSNPLFAQGVGAS